MAYNTFFASLSDNGKQIVKRFCNYCDRYNVSDPDLRFDYLEYILSNAEKQNLISDTESNTIFDYFTLADLA